MAAGGGIVGELGKIKFQELIFIDYYMLLLGLGIA